MVDDDALHRRDDEAMSAGGPVLSLVRGIVSAGDAGTREPGNAHGQARHLTLVGRCDAPEGSTTRLRPSGRAAARGAVRSTSGEPLRQPSLSAEFASYSALTASAWSSPAGRATALYESGGSELLTTWQRTWLQRVVFGWRRFQRQSATAPTRGLCPPSAANLPRIVGDPVGHTDLN